MEAQDKIKIEAGLILQFQDGDHAAFTTLLETYSHDLLAIAHSAAFYYLGLTSEEARSAAFWGFHEGCRQFDPTSGRPLMAYCRFSVKKAIREYNGRPKSVDKKTDNNIDEPDESGNHKDDRESLEVWHFRQVLAHVDVDHLIGALPRIHQQLIRDVLGLDGIAPMGFEDILRNYNLDREAFRAVISEACTILRNIRRRNMSRFVTPFPD